MGSLGEDGVRLVGARDDVALLSDAVVACSLGLGTSRRRRSHDGLRGQQAWRRDARLV